MNARYTAATADPHELYQIAVQSPEADLAFLRRVYARKNVRPPRHLREDFCGTALLCATWARHAIIGDLVALTLLHPKDVRARSHRKPDIRVAQNFSYWIFRERSELLGYFRAARTDLARGGIFAIDVYGGPDAAEEIRDRRVVEGGFTYVWDQARYLPGSAEYDCHIHFHFRGLHTKGEGKMHVTACAEGLRLGRFVHIAHARLLS